MHAGAGRPRDWSGPAGQAGPATCATAVPSSRRPAGVLSACRYACATCARQPGRHPRAGRCGVLGRAPCRQWGSPAAGAQRRRTPPHASVAGLFPQSVAADFAVWAALCATAQGTARAWAARHEHACDPSRAQRDLSQRTSLCRHASAGSARRGASCAHASRSGSSTCGRPGQASYPTLYPSPQSGRALLDTGRDGG